MGKFVLALEGMAIQEIIQARKGWVTTSASTVTSQVVARLFVLLNVVERSVAVSTPAVRPAIALTLIITCLSNRLKTHLDMLWSSAYGHWPSVFATLITPFFT